MSERDGACGARRYDGELLSGDVGTCYSHEHFKLQRLLVLQLTLHPSAQRHAACVLTRTVSALRYAAVPGSVS